MERRAFGRFLAGALVAGALGSVGYGIAETLVTGNYPFENRRINNEERKYAEQRARYFEDVISHLKKSGFEITGMKDITNFDTLPIYFKLPDNLTPISLDVKRFPQQGLIKPGNLGNGFLDLIGIKITSEIDPSSHNLTVVSNGPNREHFREASIASMKVSEELRTYGWEDGDYIILSDIALIQPKGLDFKDTFIISDTQYPLDIFAKNKKTGKIGYAQANLGPINVVDNDIIT